MSTNGWGCNPPPNNPPPQPPPATPPQTPSCAPTPASASVNQVVQWQAMPSQPSVNYNWSGNLGLIYHTGPVLANHSSSFSTSYDTEGSKLVKVQAYFTASPSVTTSWVNCQSLVVGSGTSTTCVEGSACSSVPNTCGMTNGTKNCTTGQCLPPSDSLCAVCVKGSACTSTANVCGMTNGTRNCTTNQCVAPSDSMCSSESCVGPDGISISYGTSRTYFDSTGNVCDSQVRTCKSGGTLSGTDAYSAAAPLPTCASRSSGGSGSSGPSLPVIDSFKMTPSVVNKNSSCVMSWIVSDAENCTITGAGFGAGKNAGVTTGSLNTAPIQSTSQYKISCSNKSGSLSKTAVCQLNPSQVEH